MRIMLTDVTFKTLKHLNAKMSIILCSPLDFYVLEEHYSWLCYNLRIKQKKMNIMHILPFRYF